MRASVLTKVISVLLLIAFIPSPSVSKPRHVWQSGRIVDYDVPAPLQGRMINGRYFQPAPVLASVGVFSTYTIQTDGYLLYCGETQFTSKPPQIALQSVVRFYRDKDRVVLIDETGAEHKAHLRKQVRLR